MRKTKVIALILALTLAVSMLAGCDGGGTIANENEDVLKLEGTLCSAEPLTLTIHMHFWNAYIFDDEWPIFTEAAKKTNITLKGTASKTTTDSKQEFNTMLVNDVLPDIIHGEGVDMLKAGRDGALIPLQDLVKKYAPHIQARFDENPEAYNAVVDTDGNLYYIPLMRDASGPTTGWFIRQDWLDKLGLKTPTTLEEYYNTLVAFRDGDPNGNGVKDEVPFFARGKNPNTLYHLWDVSYNLIDMDGDKVIANTLTDEFKEATKGLAKWYKEGLIDQEIYTRNNAREQLFNSDNGGSTNDWFSSTSSFNTTVDRNLVPDFNLVSMLPPSNINGEVKNYNTRSVVTTIGWGISKDNKYISETMKYFDFWFTEEGGLLAAMGVEGVHWNRNEKGEPEYVDEVLNYSGGGAPNYVRTIGSQEFGYYCEMAPELAGMSENVREAFRKYAEEVPGVPQFPITTKTVEEQRIISEKETALKTHHDETLQNWIMGNTDIDATWDKYVADMKALGIDELVKVYQDAYDRVYK